MIRETVHARAAKKLYPDKPVILGGWHPSLLPDQTLAAEYVDIVVKGQGEDALLEIVQRIEAGESMKGIAGVGYKDGRLVFNPPRALKPIAEMPPKAYHLADFDAYERVCGTPLGDVHVEPGLPLQLRATAPTTASTAASGMRSSRSRWWRRPAIWWRATACSCCGSSTTIFWWTASARSGSPKDSSAAACKFDWSIQASTNLVSRVHAWKN